MPRAPAPPRDYLIAAAMMAGVDVATVQGPSRVQPLAKIRQHAMALAWDDGYSQPKVGDLFRRNHSTVCAAVAKTPDPAVNAAIWAAMEFLSARRVIGAAWSARSLPPTE